MASTWISVIVSKIQCNEHLICTNLFALFMHCLVHRTIASLSKLTDDVKHLKYYNILTDPGKGGDFVQVQVCTLPKESERES